MGKGDLIMVRGLLKGGSLFYYYIDRESERRGFYVPTDFINLVN